MKTKILLIAAAACLFSATASTAQTVPSYVPTNGLVGWWPFNGNANDESGNGNNGTVNGATLTTDRNGVANVAYDFDGNDWIEVATDSSQNVGAGSFTISCWALKSSSSIYDHLVTRNICTIYPDFTSSYNLRYEGASILIYGSGSTLLGTGNGGCLSTSLANPSNWSHIVGVFDNFTSTYSVFIDGTLLSSCVFSGTINTYDNNGSIYFGVENPVATLPSGPLHLTGKLDDIGIWNRALTQQEITDLYQSSSCNVPGYVPTNGLVGWWPFCGNANDESGNGNNGIVNGATLTTDKFGNSNAAYFFDGVSNFIEVTSSTSLMVSNAYTISAWVYVNSFTSTGFPYQQAIVSKIDNGDWYGGYEIRILNNAAGTDSTFGTSGRINGNFINISQNNHTVNQWYHLTVRYDGANVEFFINNQAVGSVAVNGSLETSSIPLRFGRRGGAGSNNCWYNGKIDDIGIWSRALTQQEISDLYNGTSSGISDDGTWSNLSIYPNPAMDHLTVDLSGVAADDVEQIQFLNTQGQVVATRFMNELKTVQFDTQSLSAGLYMVRIQLIDGSSVSRTVVVNK